MNSSRRMCALLVFAVLILSSRARGDESLPWFQLLKHFEPIYVAAPGQKVGAEELRRHLEAESSKDASAKTNFRFYIAECYVQERKVDEAKPLLDAILADGADPNWAEAVRAEERIRLLQKPGEAGRPGEELRQARTAYLQKIATKYPCGFAADLLFKRKYEGRRGDNIPDMGRSTSFTVQAAKDYFGMDLFEEAEVLALRAVGFMNEDDWFTKDAADLWLIAGECEFRRGNWKLADAYYIKALAAGRPLKDVLPKIAIAEKNSRENVKLNRVEARPNGEVLERIVNLCIKTQLFTDAEHALKLREATVGEIDPELRRTLLRSEADFLDSLCHFYGEGGRFRGIDVSGSAVNELRAQADKLSK